MKINVINNSPNINVIVNDGESGDITILLVEDKKKALGSVELGSVIKIGDREFIVLEHTEEGTAVISKEIVERMTYGSTCNYTTSNVRNYCISGFYDEMLDLVGDENIIAHTVDLTADDGTGINTVVDFVSILTAGRYRRYRKFLKAMHEGWWTATRVTSEALNCEKLTISVTSEGVLGAVGCYWNRGVRPFLVLNSSLLVEQGKEN